MALFAVAVVAVGVVAAVAAAVQPSAFLSEVAVSVEAEAVPEPQASANLLEAVQATEVYERLLLLHVWSAVNRPNP